MSFIRKRLRPRLLLVYALALALIWLAAPTPLSLVAGLLLVGAGEGLRLWATGHLLKTDALTVTGPYAFLRHPLYLGTLLIASGFAVMAHSRLALLVWAIFLAGYFAYYMPYKNRIEGARLEALYGDAYRRYAVAVPRLVPRLMPYRPLAAERPDSTRWRSDRFTDNHEVGTAAVVALSVLAMVCRWALA
jgi:protein-S-isoprenylcysteine O-methyltransferase Ste14